MLIDQGADTNIADENHNTALHIAVTAGKSNYFNFNCCLKQNVKQNQFIFVTYRNWTCKNSRHVEQGLSD